MTASRVMYFFAGFLIACGLTAYFRAPPEANATTALVVPAVAAVLIFICGIMANMIRSNRTVGMIGIHGGLALTVLYVIAFGMRAYSTFSGGDMDKRYLAYTLLAMTLGSIVAFVFLLRLRPSKDKRV